MILTDDDIADFLSKRLEPLFCASELLFDTNGQRKDLNSILAAHIILNEAINELILLIQRLRVNGNVYKTRHDYLRLLQREKEYKDDERYYQSLREGKGVDAESIPKEPGNEIKQT